MPSPLFGGPEPLLLLLIALAVDAYVGDIPLLSRLVPGPATLIGRIVTGLDRRLNRIERSDRVRWVRGAIVALGVAAAAAAAGWVIARLARGMPAGWMLELVLVLLCLSVRAPWDRARAVEKALETGGTAAGREAARALTSRYVYALDSHGIVRAAVEATARAANQRMVAPSFWYVLFGLPGLLVWTAVNAMDAVIGHRSPRYARFGQVAARLDDFLNFVPARLTGLFLVAGAVFIGGTSPREALGTMAVDARRHRSLNAGWPEAAMAGALGLSLGGPRREGEVVIKEAWIGKGRARAVPADIRRALALYGVTGLLTAGTVAGVILVLTWS